MQNKRYILVAAVLIAAVGLAFLAKNQFSDPGVRTEAVSPGVPEFITPAQLHEKLGSGSRMPMETGEYQSPPG